MCCIPTTQTPSTGLTRLLVLHIMYLHYGLLTPAYTHICEVGCTRHQYQRIYLGGVNSTTTHTCQTLPFSPLVVTHQVTVHVSSVGQAQCLHTPPHTGQQVLYKPRQKLLLLVGNSSLHFVLLLVWGRKVEENGNIHTPELQALTPHSINLHTAHHTALPPHYTPHSTTSTLHTTQQPPHCTPHSTNLHTTHHIALPPHYTPHSTTSTLHTT